jgi:Zn-dependent membrane protease YugP
MMIWIIVLVPLIASWYIGYKLKSKFKEYSELAIGNNLSGKEIAEKMLRDNGIDNVKVTSVEGALTDHYNPLNKTVNLSHDVYFGRNVAAAAVAAHECGHAVQHANAYSFLQMRSALVPVVSFASNWVQWILLAGVLLVAVFPYLLLFGIILFALTTIFSFITLPVEIDASRRALVWLENSGLTTSFQHDKAKDALKWAARTYIVAALASLGTLIYYVLIFLGNRD